MRKTIQAYLAEDYDSFAILQLNDDPQFAHERFVRLSELTKRGLKPNAEHYEVVYIGSLNDTGMDIEDYLEHLYMVFNIERPDDFQGHSLSVSDIVAIRKNGTVRFWFCDSIGFKEVPEFLEPAEEKRYFSVSFQWNETNADGFPVFCTNIAHARDQKAVEEHYRKYPWVRVREAGMAELHTASKRGMPIVEI